MSSKAQKFSRGWKNTFSCVYFSFFHHKKGYSCVYALHSCTGIWDLYPAEPQFEEMLPKRCILAYAIATTAYHIIYLKSDWSAQTTSIWTLSSRRNWFLTHHSSRYDSTPVTGWLSTCNLSRGFPRSSTTRKSCWSNSLPTSYFSSNFRHCRPLIPPPQLWPNHP